MEDVLSILPSIDGILDRPAADLCRDHRTRALNPS
jgi:hypothetical protein